MSFNILGSPKTFGDVRVGETVYILDFKDQSIRGVTVTQSHIHPRSKAGVWVIEAYLPFRINSIKDDSLEEAKKFGTRVTQQFFINRKEYLVLLLSKIPTVLATEQKYIESWMKKESNLILLKRNV